MFAAGRSRVLMVIGTAAVLGGCSTDGGGVRESKIIAALDMKKVQGRYAIDANPFCSVSKLLGDAQAVQDASSSHRVIASRDGTVGVEIVKPFAPKCRNEAQRKLNRLAGLRRHHGKRAHGRKGHHHGKAKRHGAHGKPKKGGRNGG